jgi:hypothetical protein
MAVGEMTARYPLSRRSSFDHGLKMSSSIPQFQGKYGDDQAQRDEIGDHKREIAY